jgi:hypothetical protein
MQTTLKVSMLALLMPGSQADETFLGAGMNFAEDFPGGCDTISDCFNCTLSNCNWGAGGCQMSFGGIEKGETTVEFIFKNAPICGDPLQACKTTRVAKTCEEHGDCAIEMEEYDRDEFHWNPETVNGTLPRGYFCTKEMEVFEGGLYPYLFVNSTSIEGVGDKEYVFAQFTGMAAVLDKEEAKGYSD